MKNKSIKINIHYDKATGKYKPECRSDASPSLIKYAFDYLSYSNGKIVAEKIKHTRRYIAKEKIKSFIKRTAYVFKAVKIACSKDFNKSSNNVA